VAMVEDEGVLAAWAAEGMEVAQDSVAVAGEMKEERAREEVVVVRMVEVEQAVVGVAVAPKGLAVDAVVTVVDKNHMYGDTESQPAPTSGTSEWECPDSQAWYRQHTCVTPPARSRHPDSSEMISAN
jgi:hypothetical protein